MSAQLVRGQDGHTLWSGRFDDRAGDLFDLQDRIAVQVAGQLLPDLRPARITRARRHAPEARSAYELTLTALPHFWVHDSRQNDHAIDLLKAAGLTGCCSERCGRREAKKVQSPQGEGGAPPTLGCPKDCCSMDCRHGIMTPTTSI